MMNAALSGKPYAGNQHIRFEERGVASERPRRGSLLYKRPHVRNHWTVAGTAVCLLASILLFLCDAWAVSTDGKIRTGLYVGPGGRSNGAVTWLQILDSSPEIELTLLEGEDVRAGRLGDIDVLVMPGGTSVLQANSLGQEGREEIRRYLREGGLYFGTCAGCSLSANREGMLRILPYVKRSVKARRGSTMLGMDFTPEGMAALGLSVSNRNVCYHSGPLLTPTKPIPEVSNLRILATFAGNIMQNGPADFEMQGHPAIIHANYGMGSYLVTAYHPEYYPVTYDLIAGGFRLLTGRTVTIPSRPRRSDGARPVGYYTPGVSGKGSFAPVLELSANPNVDLQLIDNTAIESGRLSHLETLVLPDGDAAQYGKLLGAGFAHESIRDFLRQGGRVLAWGAGESAVPCGAEHTDADRLLQDVLRKFSRSSVTTMLNVAHRGLWKEAYLPQNTVESIKAAYDAGATMVETDFVETKSGEIICLHDRNALASMSTVVKDPAEITAADRAAINLGENMGLPRPYRIPLLADVLVVVPKDRMIQAEIKVYGPTYARQFDAAVRAAGLSETNVLVSSFNHANLKDFHEKCPMYRTLWLGCGVTGRSFDVEKAITMAKDGGFDIVCPGSADARMAGFVRADADRIRAAGFDFRVYGVNDESLLEYAAGLGATGFTCNYFKAAYEWARHLGNLKLLPEL